MTEAEFSDFLKRMSEIAKVVNALARQRARLYDLVTRHRIKGKETAGFRPPFL
jgi:hypothetical protein